MKFYGNDTDTRTPSEPIRLSITPKDLLSLAAVSTDPRTAEGLTALADKRQRGQEAETAYMNRARQGKQAEPTFGGSLVADALKFATDTLRDATIQAKPLDTVSSAPPALPSLAGPQFSVPTYTPGQAAAPAPSAPAPLTRATEPSGGIVAKNPGPLDQSSLLGSTTAPYDPKTMAPNIAPTKPKSTTRSGLTPL